MTSLPYQAHSETSRNAAKAFRPRAQTAREKVFRLLEDTPGGLTDEETSCVLSMPPNTERPRRVELERQGLIADSGRVRGTDSGMKAVVWQVVTGAQYPLRWPVPKLGSPSDHLCGLEKALFEIRAAIPPKKRSPEVSDALSRLECLVSEKVC